tara:strand:- start:500 stop:640 length:141 start_codon:yes stop_codon:yes gene_type:complete
MEERYYMIEVVVSLRVESLPFLLVELLEQYFKPDFEYFLSWDFCAS